MTSPSGRGAPASGDRALRLRIDASSIGAYDLLVLVNMAEGVVDFALPTAADGLAWRRLVDTGATFEGGFNCWSAESGEVIVGGYGAQPWTVVVLAELPADEAGDGAAGSGSPRGRAGNAQGNRTSVVTQVVDAVTEAVRSWLRRP